jgi:hypothetical protein
MDRVTSAVIDLVEAGYDMHAEESGWFAELVKFAQRIFDGALGCPSGLSSVPLAAARLSKANSIQLRTCRRTGTKPPWRSMHSCHLS